MLQLRIQIAAGHRALARAIYKEDNYADHVTSEQKSTILDSDLVYAYEIEAGDHDNNFTIWQKMNTLVTGECVALLAVTS